MSDVVSDQDIDRFPESSVPAEAFALLGNEIRIQILRALWAAPETPVTFSDLFRATDVDDSAQFNYHLRQLTHHFVQQTEGGYRLRQTGTKVIQAVLAGSFDVHHARTLAISDRCVKCNGSLEAVYEDETIAITCTACHHSHGTYPFPPGGLNDRTDAEVLKAFDNRVRRLYGLAKDGVCPECNGRMQTVIATPDDAGDCNIGDAPLRAGYVCKQCSHTLSSGIGLGLIDDSTLVSFYESHGIDLETTPFWRLRWCVSDESVRIRSHDPLRVRVGIELGGDTLEVTLDRSLTVCETRLTSQRG